MAGFVTAATSRDGVARTQAGARWLRTRAFVLATVLALGALTGCAGGTTGLVGPTWRWTHATEFGPYGASDVSDPSRYTLALDGDGSVHVKADCNTVRGTYETDGDEITLSLGPSTRAACPDGSLGDRFVELLHTVARFSVDGDDLTLRLENVGGTMTLSAEG